jgi:hypothetical protein
VPMNLVKDGYFHVLDPSINPNTYVTKEKRIRKPETNKPSLNDVRGLSKQKCGVCIVASLLVKHPLFLPNSIATLPGNHQINKDFSMIHL